jgi:ribosomal protein S18 acetylase RimI-like enzyme
MNFRLYAATDFPALYAIEEACFQPPHRFSRRYMRDLIENADAATWIAEENGVMTGFAIADWARDGGQVVAYIQTIEVAPECRGRGVGSELLDRIEGSASAAGARVMWLHVDASNERAIALYEAKGYRRRRSVEHYYGRGQPALVYEKDLDAGRSPRESVQSG